MKIKIIVFGKTAKKFLTGAENFYLERISPFCKAEIIVLPEEKISKTVGEKMVKEKEAEKLFAKISENDFLIACDPNGKMMSSPEFAQEMEKSFQNSSTLVFVVGGSMGLSEKVLERANKKISFSPMTLPHDLFRTFLLEQIYRGFMISGNRQYHK